MDYLKALWPLILVALLVVSLVKLVKHKFNLASATCEPESRTSGSDFAVALCVGAGVGMVFKQLAIGVAAGLVIGLLLDDMDKPQ